MLYTPSISIDYDTDSGTLADVGGGFAPATVRFLIPDFKSRRMTYWRGYMRVILCYTKHEFYE